MFGSSILEVAIGLIFVYLLLSLICSAVNEIIEAWLKNRATDLERGIRELFGNEKTGELVKKFYDHPLIKGLYGGSYETKKDNQGNVKPLGFTDYFLKSSHLPSYIPAGNFAFTVMDILLHDTAGKSWTNPYTNVITAEAIRSAIDKLPNTEVQRALRTIAEQSGGDLSKMRENIEAWFNSSMDRVSGWYTRRTKWIILVLGLVLTIALNVNSITIVKRLSNDNALRNAVAAQAEKSINDPTVTTPDLDKNRRQLEELGLPIGRDNFGWYSGESGAFDLWNNLFLHLFGWLLTAAAISLGAPFWFDVLNKFMVIRSTVKPHEKSPEESSEDRQLMPNQPTPTLTTIANPQVSETNSSFELFQPREWSVGDPQEGIV